MKAISYLTEKGEPCIGIETDEGWFNFTQLWRFFKDIKNFPHAPELPFLQIMVEMEYFSVGTFKEVLQTVKEIRPLDDVRVSGTFRIQVPVSRPTKILCLGRNYMAHAKEWKSEVPEKPMFFAKLPSSLLPHDGKIMLPDGIGRVDHEIEMAVVIGKKCSRVSENKAMEYVAGYTIANDVTARDWQGDAIKKGRPWTLAKSLDTFCPMGPFLIPADAINDPHNLDLELKVNGETKQKANTGDMVFKIPELIAYMSRYITMEAGDIICTGTPEGTLPIQPGDRIEATIEGLGKLENTVVAIG